MTITQIECFIEAARMKSLSKAATNLFISQPAVSRQIRALETDLGFQLFERKNVGVVLTPMGEILYAGWSEMLLIYRSTIDMAKDIYFGEQKKIRIGILEDLINTERITDTLIHYNQKYSDLDVEYEILQMSELLRGMEQGRFHIIITYASEVEEEHGLKKMILDEVPMRAGLVYGRYHPLSKKKRLEISDIQGTIIGTLTQNASVDHKRRVEKFLDHNGLSQKVELKEFDSRHNLKIALITGKCITVMYEGTIIGRENKLMFHPLELEKDISKVVVVWRDEKYAIKAKNITQMY